MMNIFRNARRFSSVIKGPDKVLPSTNVYSCHAEVPVRILREDNDATPISVYTCFKQRVEKSPNHPALVLERNGIKHTWTYSEYFEEVEAVAKAQIRLGLERYHGTCVIGFNAPQWYFSLLGAQFAGGVGVGVYRTSSSDICYHQAKETKANLFIVEDDTQLQKVLNIKHRLPHLNTIVQYSGKPASPGVLSWSEFLEIGKGGSDSMLKERLEDQSVNQGAIVCFTSGTTGLPKGAIISQDSMITGAREIKKHSKLEDGLRMISYLPSNHLLGLYFDVLVPLLCESTVYFAKPDAFEGSLYNTIKQVKPTFFLAVPRVLEKLQNFAKESLSSENTSNVKQKQEAIKSIGLDECSLLHVSAAPCPEPLLKFFEYLGKPACEVYGMTEAGFISFSNNRTRKISSTGIVYMESKVDRSLGEDLGELLVRGRSLFMGYINDENKTAATFDEDGFLKTGDLVKMDQDRYIYMTGRVKEILITSGGLNIAPLQIENNIKEALPVLSNCMIVGDKKKYISALLTFKTKQDEETKEMTNELQDEVVAWCQSLGYNVNSLEDLRSGKYLKIERAINDAIEKANSKALNRVHQVKSWYILPQDFSVSGGELGPTLKLKRSVVMDKYKDIIEKL